MISPLLLVDLKSYWNPSLGDNALSSDPTFAPAGYRYYRTEGRVFRTDAPRPPRTVPLHTWVNATRGDYFTTSNPLWRGGHGDTREGYRWVRLEGFVFESATAGTLPLQLWWSEPRLDNFSTADPQWTSSTGTPRDDDYRFARKEGYILPTFGAGSFAPPSAFHRGTMGSGSARGTIPLLVLSLSYVDRASRHTPAQLERLMFGPDFPNVAGYVNEMSAGALQPTNAAIWPVVGVDDSMTMGDERSYAALWDPSSPRFTFVALKSLSGKWVGAVNGGGGATYSAARVSGSETYGFVNLSDPLLLTPGNRVAFKAPSGHLLNVDGTTLRATAGHPTVPSAQFNINAAGGGALGPGSGVTLRSATTGKFLRETAAGIDVGADVVGPDTTFIFTKASPDMDRQLWQAISGARSAGHDFSRFDADADGIVTREELIPLIVGASPATPVSAGGATRWTGRMALSTDGLRLDAGYTTGMAEDASLSTVTHELLHHFAALDLYGAAGLNQNVTLMGATIFGGADDRQSFHLDPWHKMRLGWGTPTIAAVNEGGGSTTVTAPIGTGATLLLYDPSRYDVAAKRGEFFMVEQRARVAGRYDQDVAASGVFIWQCETDDRGNAVVVPHSPTGFDASINLFGNPGGVRGGVVPWQEADGRIALAYRDGTDANISLRVGAWRASGVTVEWSRTGIFQPRIDTAPLSVRGGSVVTLTGVFPARTPTVRLQNTATRVSSTATEVASSAELVTFRVPALVPGNYLLTLLNGIESNEVVLTVTL